ncbi:MAG: nucleotidyltransferase domain-containing protein [Syntrophobacterales bacterium]|nr:MAG: nucleotidyltransferase domain-containing protein [Syntrophobacterales bacterium]
MGFGFEFYKGMLERFLELLKQTFGDSLVSLVLYGSVARGDAEADSDIDLLLILRDPPNNYHRRLDQVLGVQSDLEREEVYKRMRERLDIEPFLSHIILSKEEADENRYIYLDMVEDAKILYDRDNFFAQRLKVIKKRLRELHSKRVWLEDGTWYWDLKPDLKPGEVFTL